MTLLSLLPEHPVETLAWDDTTPEDDVLYRECRLIAEIPRSPERDSTLTAAALQLGMAPCVETARVFVADGVTVAVWF